MQSIILRNSVLVNDIIGSVKCPINSNLFYNHVSHFFSRPTASEVLTAYLLQCNEPPWTSYFVKYSSVKDDQFGMSNFNWKVGNSNYQILRTGCFPYIKYHCSRRHVEDLGASDKFMRTIKVFHVYYMDLQQHN
ncbi:uncharacterized protein C15orf61 isoform X2 [Amyelois transitella]|uniref:uncharacterized protein C15orf61 isoform X2 n=1 Tax=Amyelois transitella TaxID=680683 RepID=UPI00298F6675|nr:uncharacterized protein C15orf61 isoform X2 [Amyelois transitella]